MIGVNLAGGEFGTNYIYPNNQEIDYYASKGMDVIRIPFKWERLQPVQAGALDQTELSRLKAAVDYATSKGLKVVLDVHNYGKGYGSVVGSAATPDSSFADLWSKLATTFKANPEVIFGLMNEPNSQNATQWVASANLAIDAIRDAGASQQILVPGAYHDAAQSWVSSDNDTVVGQGVVDPLNNYSFEVHQYLDANNSGTSRTVASADVGVSRISAVTQWAKDHNQKLFLAEFGVSNEPTAVVAMDRMLQFMEQNASVWKGATYWAGGSGWGDYMFSIQPDNLANPVDKVQMDVLEKYDLDPITPVPALSPPPPPPDGLAMSRGGSPSVINEGETMSLTFTVRNAVAGQSFEFWQQSVMDTDDFVRSLAEDFAAVLPAGATFTELTPLRGIINLAPGTYTFTLNRQAKLDGVTETIDKASFAEGNQENTDIKIGNFLGGLKNVSETTAITNWVTDRATLEPTAPPPPNGALKGTDVAETLNGTSGNDAIYGFNGNDALNGLAGNDLLVGDLGNDRLEGGTGSDTMWGGAGTDTYYVDNPGDQINEAFGGGTDAVNSSVSYALSNNVENLFLKTGASINATGNAINNRLEGNSGANVLSGHEGNDSLTAYSGNDTLIGGEGNDALNGGEGADLFVFDTPTSTSQDQVRDFGLGADKVGLAADAFGLVIGAGLTSTGAFDPGWFVQGASPTADHGQFFYNAATSTLSWDPDGTGTAAAITLATFNAGVNLQLGSFTILGGETPPPQTSSSLSIAATDAVKSEGTTGSTAYAFTVTRSGNVSEATSVTYAVTGSGANEADFTGAAFPTGTLSFGANEVSKVILINVAGDTSVEANEAFTVNLTGASNGATIAAASASGTIQNDDVAPPQSSNEILGNDTANSLKGTPGNDHILGMGGNDTLDGAAGADALEGSTGSDLYYVDNAGDRVIELADQGTDIVNAYVSFTLQDNTENIALRSGANLAGTGNVLNNKLDGNSGANTLSGLAGNDTLKGYSGNDVLSGGSGNDAFVFNTSPNSSTNSDQITDFAPGVDRIHLENGIFTAVGATGALAAGAFRLGLAAGDADDRVIYDQSTGSLYYDADGNGTGAGAIRFATLTTKPNLSNADILVI